MIDADLFRWPHLSAGLEKPSNASRVGLCCRRTPTRHTEQFVQFLHSSWETEDPVCHSVTWCPLKSRMMLHFSAGNHITGSRCHSCLNDGKNKKKLSDWNSNESARSQMVVGWTSSFFLSFIAPLPPSFKCWTASKFSACSVFHS